MLAFFSILLAVVLLGITVYGLHRYQTMEVEYTVDRSMPLPPLEESEVAPRATDSQPASAPSPGARKVASPASPAAASAADKPAPKQEPKPQVPGKSKSGSGSSSWLDTVAALKKTGELDQAMRICEKEFPLWGAYNQACIIERLRLKKLAPDSEAGAALLRRLYRLAATAELLHDKSDEADHLTLNQLKALDLTSLENLDHPYAAIGYAHLRLIRKSDVKFMQALWGRPDQHQLPRHYHQSWWRSFSNRVIS